MKRCLLLTLVIALFLPACSETVEPGGDGSPVGGAGWFAGYVDVTLPSKYEIDKPPTQAASNAVLSFIVAAPQEPCSPSWGGHHSMERGESSLGLDRRISRLREGGGQITVSFGGQLGAELATVCRDSAQLATAYSSVIDRYGLDTVDLDIEGDDLDDPGAGVRRAEVMAQLQRRRSIDDPLHVWLTLPVTPAGLTDRGVDTVTQMLTAGVELAGVNIMIMNYSASRLQNQSMLDASKAAARSTHDQLDAAYRQTGSVLNSEQLWGRIGITPMIGNNDVDGEVVDIAAAKELNEFARSQGISRISMWSLNRDRSCGSAETDLQQPSNTCSGVGQETGEFARILGTGFTGTIK